MKFPDLTRRRILQGGALGAGSLVLQPWLPSWAQPVSAGLPTLSGEQISLRVEQDVLNVDGKLARAVNINGTVPAPLLRLMHHGHHGHHDGSAKP